MQWVPRNTTHKLWLTLASNCPNPEGRNCVEDELYQMFSFLQSKPTGLKRAIEDDNVAQTIEILKQQNSLLNEYCVLIFPSLFSLRVSYHDPIQIVPTIILHGKFWVSPTFTGSRNFSPNYLLNILYKYLFKQSTHSIKQYVRGFNIFNWYFQLIFIWTINSFNQTGSKRIWYFRLICIWTINSSIQTDSKRIWYFRLIFIWTINSFNQTDSKRIWYFQLICIWTINSSIQTGSKRIWYFRLIFIWTINSFNQTVCKRIWYFQLIFIWTINSFNQTGSKRIWYFHLISIEILINNCNK